MKTLFLAAAAAVLLATAAHAKPMPEFPAVDETSFTEPSGDRVLALSVEVPASPRQVWQALSTEAGWNSFAVKMAKVDFRQGGIIETSYDASAQPGQRGNIKNEILAIVPERLLVIRNLQAPPDFAHAEAFGRTITAIEIAPTAGGSRVSIWATGYKPGAAFDDLLKMFRMGDAWTLDELRKSFAGVARTEDIDLARARFVNDHLVVHDESRTFSDGTRMIRESVVVHAPVAALWKGFTDAKAYQAWGAPWADIELANGGHMEVAFTASGHVGDPNNLRHAILAYAPERLLVFRNTQAPKGLPGAEVFGGTRIVLEFEDLGGGDSRVTLSQTGYGQGAAYDALWDFFHPHNAEMLENLKASFEKPAGG